MPDARHIATDIDTRVNQLERQGVSGPELVNRMIAHISDMHWLCTHTSDAELADLCDTFPGFYRYAVLMEEMSARDSVMRANGAHPYMNLPEITGPLRDRLVALMRVTAELERGMHAATEHGRTGAHDHDLVQLRRKWATALCSFDAELNAACLPRQVRDVLDTIVGQLIKRHGR